MDDPLSTIVRPSHAGAPRVKSSLIVKLSASIFRYFDCYLHNVLVIVTSKGGTP